MQAPKQSTEAVFVWLFRSFTAILVYLAIEMRSDLKELRETVPALNQQIINLQHSNDEMRHKIFAIEVLRQPAKKDDEIDYSSLIKFTANEKSFR